MRIGFDISQTGSGKAGCGFFTLSLVQALEQVDADNEYVLYPTFGDFFCLPDWQESTYHPTRRNFTRGLGHADPMQLWEFWNRPAADVEAQLGNPDLVHSNNFYCPPKFPTARLVYTLYDLSFVAHPEWTTETNRMGCFDGVFNAGLRAERMVAISHYTKQHFLETFPHYPEDRIDVAHLGSRFPADAPPQELPERFADLPKDQFWFCAGTIEPRKNHMRLVQAYARWKESVEGKPMPLVLAGGKGWLMDDFLERVRELGVQDDVIHVGYVSEEEMLWLYQNCFAFVYPTLFEGFGLPVLEAMEQGAAVITSNVSAVPEVAGDACILIEPTDVDELAQALTDLAADSARRDELVKLGRHQAATFSWENCARQVVEVYRKFG